VNSVRNDTETMACAVCGTAFRRSGRRLHCSQACRQAAWRRRSQAPREPIVAKVDTSTSARCVRSGSSASSTARSATASPAGSAPAAPVLAVMSRSQSPSSSSRNSSWRARVKDDTREVIREQDRRKGAAIPSTGIDYFSKKQPRNRWGSSSGYGASRRRTDLGEISVDKGGRWSRQLVTATTQMRC